MLFILAESLQRSLCCFLIGDRVDVLDSLRALDLGQIHRNAQLLVQLVKHCVSTSHGLAVLVFLPGLREISDLWTAIDEANWPAEIPSCSVVPLHGELTAQQQRKVFATAPAGSVKVVLATNIAETSITIDDVGVVIDTGTRRAMHYDPHTNTSALLLQRISKASAKQRAGRAGRVQAGVCYHLFLQQEADKMMLKHDEPEILHLPLDASCLRLKVFAAECVYSIIGSLILPSCRLSAAGALHLVISGRPFRVRSLHHRRYAHTVF